MGVFAGFCVSDIPIVPILSLQRFPVVYFLLIHRRPPPCCPGNHRLSGECAIMNENASKAAKDR